MLCISAFFLAEKYWVLALAVLIGAATFSVHAATLQHSVLARYAKQGTEVTLVAKVTSDTKTTNHKVRGSTLSKPQSSFLVRAHSLKANAKNFTLRLPVRVLSTDPVEVSPGDEVVLAGRLIVTKERRVAATLITNSKVELISSARGITKFLSVVRTGFRAKAAGIGGDAASLIPGMILGDTSLQSEEFSQQMRRSGLSHLTAVSGANFAIVSALVFWLTKFVNRRILFQVLATSSFLLLFLLLVRPSPSVLRAGIMAAVILLARASGNTRNAVSALGAAISLLLLLDPFQSQDPGFVLSVLATSGLIFLAPLIKSKLERLIPNWLAEVLAVSTAATLLCTPYILYLSGEVSVFSILFNVLVSPVVAPITIIGFFSVISMPITLISELLLSVAVFLAKWVAHVSELSLLSPSWSFSPAVLLTLVSLSVVIWFKSKRAFLVLMSALLLLNFVPVLNFPGRDWKIAQCDVGQGDALVINLGQETGLVFDVGPDANAIDRCLRSLRISRVLLLVLSHNHADHTFGVNGVFRGRQVDQIWTNSNISVKKDWEQITYKVMNGTSVKVGAVEINTLWPMNQLREFSPLPGDGSAENNQSLVQLVNFDGVLILVTGDIEPEVQSALMRTNAVGEIDILKVPHHGSRFQDIEFLQSLKPKIALISVGKENNYGHPAPELIHQLAGLGAVVRRTDQDGPISVAWRFDDRAKRYIFTTREMRKEWWRIQWR